MEELQNLESQERQGESHEAKTSPPLRDLMMQARSRLDRALDRIRRIPGYETGVPGTKLPDEVVSLPSAFIRAGFAGAIGSLWTVRDDSTAQLITSFYQIWRTDGKQPVQALAEAQRELREDERFRHPFYWAAFNMTGV